MTFIDSGRVFNIFQSQYLTDVPYTFCLKGKQEV